MLTLLTESEGRVGARLRHGRKSSKRAAGGVEPFHTLDVVLEDRGGELLTLKETRIAKVRAGVVADLDAMEVAGVALRWARHLLPPRHAEPAAWKTLTWLMDALDLPERGSGPPRGLLAIAGFALLSSVGYALDLGRCVVCGRPCPAEAPAFVDATRGGLICRACGGRGRLLDGPTRDLAARAQWGEDGAPPVQSPAEGATVPDWLTAAQTEDLLAVLGDAMAAHAGLDPSR